MTALLFLKFWYTRQDSNLRPSGSKSDAAKIRNPFVCAI